MIRQLNGRAEQVFDGKMNKIQLSHFNEAMAHIAAMDFFWFTVLSNYGPFCPVAEGCVYLHKNNMYYK